MTNPSLTAATTPAMQALLDDVFTFVDVGRPSDPDRPALSADFPARLRAAGAPEEVLRRLSLCADDLVRIRDRDFWAPLFDFLGPLATALCEVLTADLEFRDPQEWDRDVLASLAADAGRLGHDPLRVVAVIGALHGNDLALMRLATTRGISELAGWRVARVLGELEMTDPMVAAAFVTTVSEDLLAELTRQAADAGHARGLEYLLRAGRSRDVLPARHGAQSAEVATLLEAVASAHGYLRWRLDSDAWLTEHGAA